MSKNIAKFEFCANGCADKYNETFHRFLMYSNMAPQMRTRRMDVLIYLVLEINLALFMCILPSNLIAYYERVWCEPRLLTIWI